MMTSYKLKKSIVKLLWGVFLTGSLSFYLLTKTIIHNTFGFFGEIPGFEILENPKNDLASTLYSENGQFLGSYYATNRKHIRFEDISQNVLHSLYTTEDIRFEKHSGIDFRSTFRVVKGVLTGNLAGGGSTISQQLAKNLFELRREKKYRGKAYSVPGMKMIVIKAKEWITATRLETSYTKEEIVTMYLNTVNFGTKAIGIESAALTYFNKPAAKLNLQEAATLVGTLAANTTYDPYLNYDQSIARRNTVISQMKKYKWITAKEKDSLIALPIELDMHEDNYNSGVATYFRSHIKEELSKLTKELGYNLLTDGLKIYTTINYELQLIAEKEVANHLQKLQQLLLQDWGKSKPWTTDYIIQQLKNSTEYKNALQLYQGNEKKSIAELYKPRKTKIFTFQGEKDTLISPINEWIHYNMTLRAGMVSIQPHSGHLKAWVGGINQKHFAYDHVGQGKRQPGSVFKAILYATAIQNGYTPCTEILDGPVSMQLPDGKIWSPEAKPSGEIIPLKTAMARSINNIAAHLIKDIGPENLLIQAKRFGIDTQDMSPVPSLALGTAPVNLLEMTAAYNAFASNGNYIKPNYILRIEDKNGKTIYSAPPALPKKIMGNYEAFEMVQMLREGALYNEYVNGKYHVGTSRRLISEYHLDENGNQIGGKTGTTQNAADGWYLGITPHLVSGIWVGGTDNRVHFQNSTIGNTWGQAARMALPIFGETMKKAYNKKILSPAQFQTPENIGIEQIDKEIGCVSETKYP